jgi:hypothetical protein
MIGLSESHRFDICAFDFDQILSYMTRLFYRRVPAKTAAKRQTGFELSRLSCFWLQVIAIGALISGRLFADQFGDFTYTVSGSSATITGYPKTAAGDVSIPSTISGKNVVAIGSAAFSNCTLITSVTIPLAVR